MSPVISVEGISKCYRIGAIGRSTLRGDVGRLWARMRGRADPLSRVGEDARTTQGVQHIWALRDVSFQVSQGEALGIVGSNGAGKSTLLKILSRVTAPTAGQVKLRGRVASLLEVGTGFHPELTGRENVYLNGAILGMTRAEVASKFDEIVDFSGVEPFIDTPVKRYSSGMYVRLAFAVAAHMEPDILVVDEVLAVGDAAFQSKCLGKMNDVTKQAGRTVLFVSHNMAAVERLCGRCVFLADGRVALEGPPTEVLPAYLKRSAGSVTCWEREGTPPAHSHFRRLSLHVDDQAGGAITTRTPLDLRIVLYVASPQLDLRLGVVIHDGSGSAIFSTSPMDDGVPYPTEKGTYEYRVSLAAPIFMAQSYSLTVSLYARRQFIDVQWHVLGFVVQEVASPMNRDGDSRMGVLQVQCRWSRSRRPE